MKTPKKKQIQNRLTKTGPEYARLYERDIRTIRRWIALGYPLDDPERVAELELGQKNSARAAAVAAAVRVDARTLTDEELQNPPDLAHAKLYQLILTCRRQAHANQRERGEYFPRAGCIEAATRMGAAVNAALATLEAVLPGRLLGLDAAAAQKLLREEHDKIRRELSNTSSRLYAVDTRQ